MNYTDQPPFGLNNKVMITHNHVDKLPGQSFAAPRKKKLQRELDPKSDSYTITTKHRTGLLSRVSLAYPTGESNQLRK